MVANSSVNQWIDEMATLCQPDRIVWCDGSVEEKKRLTAEALSTGELLELNQDKLPGCYLHRTAKNDVARTEHLTFICTEKPEDVGPTNNWMKSDEAYAKLSGLFDGSMKGRTMYVVPFIMGVPGSPFSKIGIELTDSIYVVLNMRIMTRMGQVAMDELGGSSDFTKCLHSKHELDIDRRFICHFPEDNTIWSIGSGYGGNVLLGKKCLALRIASNLGRKEGWMAEHMLILGLQNPQGETFYIAAAFPSACGKTNLAMLVPPEEFEGWKVWTVGDDIAWMRIGPDGRLWALNPEAGFFGVVPGTNMKSNPNAMLTIQKNTIYTNVLLKDDKTIWWEGHDDVAPEHGIDWQGNDWTPACGEKGAHPNSRFTAPAYQCPSIAPNWEDPQGVPISAILFGGRRAKLTPLVYQSFNWQHGTFVGATMSSETTAAALGAQGVVRRDPMAMLPFCGYNMSEYFAHWLQMGKKLKNAP
ncbi:MAG TPA: phosphoenolpyruvate carboxykinase (GTP), partial [Armatimonadota bacterium]